MANHSSASMREHTPHANQTSRTNMVVNALKRRAQAVLNDRSIDSESRAIIRYALETNDPWLSDLVRHADSGKLVVGTIDFSPAPELFDNDASAEKIEEMVEIICLCRHRVHGRAPGADSNHCRLHAAESTREPRQDSALTRRAQSKR